MLYRVKTFLTATDGAVVADYVVLTATLVSLSFTSVNAVRNGVGSLSDRINTALSNASVAALCSSDGGISSGICGTGSPAGSGGSTGGGTDPTIDGGGGGGGILTGGDPTVDPDRTGGTIVDSDYTLSLLNDRDAESFSNSIRLYSVDHIIATTYDLEAELYRAFSGGEIEKTLTMLDQFYLTARVINERRGSEDAAADAFARFETARSFVKENLR